VALIGAPNAGKSTLVNQLVGAKVSIVSHKVQTTRAIVRGIAIHDRTQIVFIDTPGIFAPKRRLDRAMVTTAWGGAKDGDLVLVLIDAERGIKGDAEALLDSLAERAPAEDPGAQQDRPGQARHAAGELTAAIHEKAEVRQRPS
jgi:GTP-binding protein Era